MQTFSVILLAVAVALEIVDLITNFLVPGNAFTLAFLNTIPDFYPLAVLIALSVVIIERGQDT